VLQTLSAPISANQGAKNHDSLIVDRSNRGVFIACSIIGIWAASLLVLLSIQVSEMPIWGRAIAIVWQTFLYTGLFITAHDAMHGSVAPNNLKLNNFIGALALRVYALFSFKKMTQTHWQHHRDPASTTDPDFHNGRSADPISWYFHFMGNYWSWTRFLCLVVTYHILHRLFGFAEMNLTYFWLIPAIASSLQLFFFGTYLPHQEPKGGYTSEYRARNIGWSTFWSFVSCYHFGYHEEHHKHPELPWWKLPESYARCDQLDVG
jgi:beta-carotene/zeaxanthin 4-ketolase